jgi:MFS family permease
MWSNRNVWIVLFGEFIAGLGLWTGIIGNLEFMQRHVPSDFLKSLILFTGLLAGVLVGPLAGKMIDTKNKKSVLIYSGLGRMLSVIFMFFALEFESVWWMVLFMIAIQISAAFYFPALQSIIPLIVNEKDLLQMNGVHMNVATIARILGTALAGAMLVVMSLYSLYIASFIAYGILLASTFMLKIKEEKSNQPSISKGASSSFKEVIPVLRSVPVAVMALVLTIIPMLFIGGFNLMVINISELQDDSTIKGLLYTAEGICFMIGAFIVKKISANKNIITLMFIFTTGIAITHLTLYFADIKWMSIISFGLFGLFVGCFFPIVSTIFQTKIPKEYHGRLFSFRNMLDRVLFQVVLLGTGLLLDTIGLQKMVLVFGTISIVLVSYFAVRQVKSPIYLQEQAGKQQM